MYHDLNGYEVLACLVYGEARGEPAEGKIGTAWTAKNRWLKPKWGWPKSIKGVCLQPWQFSCFNTNDPNYKKMYEALKNCEDKAMKECLWVAFGVIGGHVQDNTRGSNHYHVAGMNPLPSWAEGKIPITLKGSHVFYKL